MSSKTLTLALLAAALAVPTPALAGSRYQSLPPVTLSPDLSAPWVLQLNPGKRTQSRTVVRRQRQLRLRSGYRPEQPRALRRYQEPNRLLRKRSGKRNQSVAAVRPAKKKPAARRGFNPALLPTVVDYHGGHKPGTIVVNTIERRLYHVMPNGKARRYGVGVGKPGFEWAGSHKVTRKAKWPSWTPPAEMRARERKKGRILPKRMEGGPNNPLGARALYLGSTLYRIHGSNQPWSIGRAVSSGCIRMRNEDVMDLYERVKVGAKVIVI
ncbi:MAG: L,D-transpeptidase [Pseudomonadota bacterium]